MQLVRNSKSFKIPASVVSIGNFEGLHLGHQALIENLVKEARFHQVPAWVMTFEPSPKQYFSESKAIHRITTFSEKLRRLKQLGVDGVFCPKFDKTLSLHSADIFVTELRERFNPKWVMIGDDFRFGYKRMGDLSLLSEMGKSLGFKTRAIQPIMSDLEKISSTRIRTCLAKGQVAHATKLMGRPFGFSARVVHGNQRGRKIGFPTANCIPPKVVLPLFGVYFVRVLGLDKPYFGVANSGLRPTFGENDMRCEVHLFDFEGDIYGKKIHIEFLEHIRAEKKFESVEALCAQVENDIHIAKQMMQINEQVKS